MNITLVGFMGTGKTAAGKALAERLNMEFVDMDDLIEKAEGHPIAEIFERNGEGYFRRIEKEVAREVSKRDNIIIATGGGVVIDEENVENLKKNGIVICLNAAPGVILERTKNYEHRPLLNVDDPEAKIRNLLAERAPYYARADYQIDTSQLSTGDVVEEIVQIVKRSKEQ